MKIFKWNKRLLLPVLVITLLVGLVGTVTGCEELGGFPGATTPTAEKTTEAASTTFTSTRDSAIMAVHERLLSQAGSYEAKIYLADFYTAADNWNAQSEYFKDGSGTWHIFIDMSASKTWAWQPYWQQASWFVYKDGRVIPSNLFNANALRIEADLQELSDRAKS